MAQRKKFLLRLDPRLWEELSRWAAREFRSVNGQIEFLLRRAVDDEGESGKRRGMEARSSVVQPRTHPRRGG